MMILNLYNNVIKMRLTMRYDKIFIFFISKYLQPMRESTTKKTMYEKN